MSKIKTYYLLGFLVIFLSCISNKKITQKHLPLDYYSYSVDHFDSVYVSPTIVLSHMIIELSAYTDFFDNQGANVLIASNNLHKVYKDLDDLSFYTIRKGQNIFFIVSSSHVSGISMDIYTPKDSISVEEIESDSCEYQFGKSNFSLKTYLLSDKISFYDNSKAGSHGDILFIAEVIAKKRKVLLKFWRVY